MSWDPERYRRTAGFVPALGEPLIDLLALQSGERVLDLGCGEGALTEKLAKLARVVGIDASAEQVAAARGRGLDARLLDAAALPFDSEFDAVFSNAALHWVRNLDAALACAFRALKPGGRFVAEMGGAGNVASVREALALAFRRRGLDPVAFDPWTFPTAEEARTRLERAGFEVTSITLFQRPTKLPSSLADWLDTFGASFLERLAREERGPVKEEITEYLKDRLCDAQGTWTVDYVRLRWTARKPGTV